MYSFKSQSTTVLWEATSERKLYLRLTNITNEEIKNIRDWFHDQTDIIFMPDFAKQILFTANLINLYLDKEDKANQRSCSEMAAAIYDMIKDEINTHRFFKDIRDVVDPYLESSINASEYMEVKR